MASTRCAARDRAPGDHPLPAAARLHRAGLRARAGRWPHRRTGGKSWRWSWKKKATPGSAWMRRPEEMATDTTSRDQIGQSYSGPLRPDSLRPAGRRAALAGRCARRGSPASAARASPRAGRGVALYQPAPAGEGRFRAGSREGWLVAIDLLPTVMPAGQSSHRLVFVDGAFRADLFVGRFPRESS